MNQNVKTILIIGGVIVAILIIVPTVIGAVLGWQGYGYGMMGSGMMGNFGWGWFMPVFMVIFWGLVIWGIVALARGTTWSGSADSSNHSESAHEILKRRYARGEINKAEYEEKKKDLV
jgi:putative membrane protein